MRIWAKLMKISKIVLVIAVALFLTSCNGIMPESDFVNQEDSLYSSIVAENGNKAKTGSVCLEVPYQRYAGVNWCLPASAAMTLNFLGLQVSQQELAQQIINPDGFGDVYKMVKYARDLGFDASFKVLTIEQIEEYLSKEIPLIAIQKYKQSNPLAHARVIIGYDALKKEIITNDPTIGGNYTISYDQFLNLNLTANPKYSMAIVITPNYI